MVKVTISEWSTASPETHKELQGLSFGDNEQARSIAQRLSMSGKLDVQELARGLTIHSTSFVGSIALGPVHITVYPKIDGLFLFPLLRYAYGLRELTFYEQTRFDISHSSFQDLLLHQLEEEARELISRGLRREYVCRREQLSSPKGRLDFAEIARQKGFVCAQLPCRHYPRSEDCVWNQMLLAGLKVGARIANDLELRARLRRIAKIMEENVSPLRLDRKSIKRIQRQSSRLTRAYDAALEIIKILLAGQGLSLTASEDDVVLPGFLFDMNLFFQRLLVKFFTEWLEGYRVEDERAIRGMIDYLPEHNPLNRRSPQPRPDITIIKGSKTATILDAKYRDLWNNELPAEMLYQLAIYALAGEACNKSTILYPTTDATAREARLTVREPHGGTRGTVSLRPVDMTKLAELLTAKDRDFAQRRSDYARVLAFGE